ncbi:MAG: branched-chain amino acid ABC transporter permease [Gammaproteobacteria bacterium]|nr:branched-chain amino acid ABC transporter permease [Gammaproteobacteria bacterium]
MKSILLPYFPKNLFLKCLILAIVTILFLAPFVLPSIKALAVASKILIFCILVASFDLLLGYTGIISFAHTMFFGIGAYGVALASAHWGNTWTAILSGSVIAILLSILLSGLIAIFSARVKTIFFSMITLAVAASFQTLVSQFSDLTGGEDGISFELPANLNTVYFKLAGVDFSSRILIYYGIFVICLVCFILLLRIVSSPFGKTLAAIRENEFRASAIGYPVILYRTFSSIFAAIFATTAGILWAFWLRYCGPDTTLSFEIMVDILLILIIGGIGTLYGALIGSSIFLIAQNYLQDLLNLAHKTVEGLAFLPTLFSPDRWLLWLGILFVLAVYFLPKGLYGYFEK